MVDRLPAPRRHTASETISNGLHNKHECDPSPLSTNTANTFKSQKIQSKQLYDMHPVQQGPSLVKYSLENTLTENSLLKTSTEGSTATPYSLQRALGQLRFGQAQPGRIDVHLPLHRQQTRGASQTAVPSKVVPQVLLQLLREPRWRTNSG
ncbi:hypothetical protein EJ05DRAFT_503708 [Pseudovirgaria hyperparasitica]|uniref:Uncharacterized protein n=1 Tax=Pseudovirgaria hyperparasitica TaxID=470096 RepID=A0A6A6VW02_9PEZI|nr:uncharacterized protein EJ05DRAFT_503708 [Pseudovirgaria hyperparasitica]KAF2754762.1 hypothetical protein EJ05DRAFT_503708 [Pseudovirgaria hyperparasitica]